MKSIIYAGTQNQNFDAVVRIKLCNWVSIFTVAISAFYSALYFTIIDNQTVGIINLGFTIAYALCPLLMHKQFIKLSKRWFFFVLMLHLWVCTNIYVTFESGFHLYYFLVPTGVFVLFEPNQNKEKIFLSVAAIVLFLLCQNTINEAPLIELSATLNKVIYQSVVVFLMLEVIAVMTLFNRQLVDNHEQVEKLSTYDTYTNSYNRHHFILKASELLKATQKSKRPFAILLVSIDDFNQLNRDYGFKDADRFLKYNAECFKHFFREREIIGRLNGHVLALALADFTEDEVKRLISRVRHYKKKYPFSSHNNVYVHNTFSSAVVCNYNQQDIEMLILQASSALKAAKNNGKNGLVVINDKRQQQ